MWKHIRNLFPRRDQTLQRELRLTQAYQAVFRGSPSRDDQELVLADLAYLSGFSMVSPATVPDAELRFTEGKRFLFATLKARLNLAPNDMEAIENAARREAAMAEQL